MMDRNARYSLLATLADQLHARGSWCGETHLQKAVFLLQAVEDLDPGFEYVLYLHGPYSFDLHDELASMRAADFLVATPKGPGYGPSLSTTSRAEQHRRLVPLTTEQMNKVEDVADLVGDKGVSELERISTAVYLKLNEPGSTDQLAQRFHEIKPHVSVDSARSALGRADELLGV